MSNEDFWKKAGEAIDAQIKELAERRAINTAKYLEEIHGAARKEMKNETLLERLQAELDNRNDDLSARDHIAIAAMEGTLSARGWHPEYIIPAGGGHVGGQRAADAAAEAAYKYADAMLKARERK